MTASAATSTREFNDLPWGDELFPYLLPWALQKQSYTNIEARQNCTKAAGLSIEQQTRKQADGRQVAWVNYVAFALKQMTELGLHTSIQRQRGIKHYTAVPAKIRAYAQSPKARAIVLDDTHNAILADFEKAIGHQPVETEVRRLVKQRIGQDILRKWLIEDRDCRCDITGIDHKALLRASHIKAWSYCDTDGERMDQDNILLLAAHVDAAFDRGLISFDSDGTILINKELGPKNQRLLVLVDNVKVKMSPKRERYMTWHRQRFGFEDSSILLPRKSLEPQKMR